MYDYGKCKKRLLNIWKKKKKIGRTSCKTINLFYWRVTRTRTVKKLFESWWMIEGKIQREQREIVLNCFIVTACASCECSESLIAVKHVFNVLKSGPANAIQITSKWYIYLLYTFCFSLFLSSLIICINIVLYSCFWSLLAFFFFSLSIPCCQCYYPNTVDSAWCSLILMDTLWKRIILLSEIKRWLTMHLL